MDLDYSGPRKSVDSSAPTAGIQVKRAGPGLSCGEVDLTTTAGPFDCLPSCHCLLIASPIRRGVLDPNFEPPLIGWP